jgi:hypothetical protein
MLRYLVFSLVLLTAADGFLNAQSLNGRVFFAPGGVTSFGNTAMTLQASGGLEAILFKGIGAGADIGALTIRQCIIDCGVGIFSPNGYYHFVHRKGASLDPFVTAGYTRLFRAGHANLFNFGGGVNFWFNRHLGLRLEARDHVWRRTYSSNAHYWGFPIGLAIR